MKINLENPMKNKVFLLSLLCIAVAIQFSSLSAATVPAGTAIMAQTVDAISSHARAGRIFAAKLAQSVVVNGNVLIPAGTQLFGVIEASRANVHRSGALTLNLTSISVNGKRVPIKTTGGFQPQAGTKTARQSRRGISVGEWTFPPGTRIEFRLAEPLNL